jgi:spore germination protein YaaH
MTTVQTLTDISKMNETTSLAKPFGYPSQSQKRSNASHNPTQVASHLLLPQRTHAHPPPDIENHQQLYTHNKTNITMKQFLTLLLVVINMTFGFTNASGQNTNFTDAYSELLKQRAMYSYPTSKWDSLRCAWYGECAAGASSSTNALRSSSCPLNKRMFGWHMIGTSSSNYVWQSISDLSYFSYDVNASTGNAINSTQIANWANDATIIAAHNNGVNVNLCVTLFNNTNEFSTFFGSSSAQTTLKNNLINAVIAANAKGINIDFEGSGLGSTYLNQFVAFMSSLSTQLHNAVPNSELSIDLQGSYSNSTSLITQLNSSVDLFIIMAYDYYWGSQGSPGPVAPTYNFYSSSYGNASNDLNNFLKIVSPNKVILGMPYYGRRWGVSNACTLPGVGSGSSAISTQTYSQYKQNSNGYYSNPQRDAYTFNAYNCFTDASSIPNQQFIDDAFSFQKKYNVIYQRGIAGGAIWRLGYDGGYSDLWNLINDNLSTCSVLPCTDTIYDMGGQFGNYHNSEDYTFTISPPNASSVTLSFLEFSLETTNDYLKVYNGTTTASPLLQTLTGSSLPSAITASSGSMTLLFHSNSSTTQAGYKAVYTCGTGSVGQPDLTPINQSVSSTTVAAGSNITAFCAENNSGNATAAANITTIYLSPDAVLTPGNNGDTYIDFINFSSVAPTSTSTVNSKSIQIPNGTAAGNYYLFFWVDGGQVVTESNETNNFASVQITIIGSATTYSISTSSNPSIGGTTSGAGNYSFGQQATVVASSNSGYTFVNWTESGSPVTTNASYTFNVTTNRNLVANFTGCNYTLNSNSVTVYSPAQSQSFWVYTAQDCNWTATASGCSWLTFTNATGTGNGMVTFNLSANTGSSSRSCTITVGGQTFTITQNGVTSSCSVTPQDPNSLSVGIIGNNQTYLSWAGSFVNVTSFQVERATSSGGPYTVIATTGTTQNYLDITGVPGTTYYYRVRACCNSNCSNYSNVVNIQACSFSVAPTGIVATTNNICIGDSVTLTVQGGVAGTGAVWTWRSTQCNSGAILGTGATTITIAPTTSGTVVVKPEGGSCATGISCVSTNITVNQLPTPSIISANGNTTFCAGGSVTLTGNNGGIWNTGATTSSINVTSSGDYFVTNTNSCGSVTSNHILVNVNPLPNANAGVDAFICNGSSTQIGSPSVSGYTYSWTPTTGLSSSTISNPVANPTSNTIYILTATTSLGCILHDTINVVVNQNPVANAGSNQAICNGFSTTIGTTLIAGNTYSWFPTIGLNNSQLAMPTANPNTTTNYTVTVTDVNGCVATSQTTVTVNSLPIVDAGNNVSITQGGSTTIGGNPTATGNGSLTYNWTPSTNLSSTSIANPLANPTTTTTYFVSVTDGKNCSATDSIIVTVNPIGCTYSLSDSSYSFAHSGGTHIFNVTTSNSSCTWTPVNSNSWFQVTPNTQQTGNGTITITADSCSNGTPRLGTFTVAGITYTVNQSCTVVSCNPPVANFAASQTTGNCPFNVDFFDLSQTTGTTIYQWTIYNGGGSPVTSSLQNPTADNSGFKKLAVQWLNEHLCFVSSVVLADSFVLRNRQLLKPANTKKF